MKKYFPPSELIINEDGSVFHLHVKPEHLADKVILVGDPGRVALVASHFDTKECEVESREFRTVTGTYQGKRITVTSTGIGCDNVDIVMNELDALANINFQTREENETFRQLEIVRIGTCGGLQPYTPVGTYICSAISVGFDGLLNFYEGRNAVCDLPMERALLNHLGWTGNLCAPAPYVIHANEELVDRIAGTDMVRGVTVSLWRFLRSARTPAPYSTGRPAPERENRELRVSGTPHHQLRDGKLCTGRTGTSARPQSYHRVYGYSEPRSQGS